MFNHLNLILCVFGIPLSIGTAISMVIATGHYFGNKWDPNKSYLAKLSLETKLLKARTHAVSERYKHEQMQQIIKNQHEHRLLNS